MCHKLGQHLLLAWVVFVVWLGLFLVGFWFFSVCLIFVLAACFEKLEEEKLKG